MDTGKLLLQNIEKYYPLLRSLQEEAVARRPAPAKWSGKELIGHLIDSAQNNIRRFIMAQYDEQAVITYRQDDWVRINHYQEQDWAALVELWYGLNKQAAHILDRLSEEVANRTCLTPEVHSLRWLAEDYIKHLQHHIHQVLQLDSVAYP